MTKKSKEHFPVLIIFYVLIFCPLYTILLHAIAEMICCIWMLQSLFFSVNMNYTLNRKNNKYNSPFDIYLTKWGENEKYEFYFYQINKTITTKNYLGILQWKIWVVIRKTRGSDGGQFENISSKVNTVQFGKISSN